MPLRAGCGLPGFGIDLARVPSRVAGMSRADHIRQSIVDPEAVIAPGAGAVGPFPMPDLALGAREVDALVAYLAG